MRRNSLSCALRWPEVDGQEEARGREQVREQGTGQGKGGGQSARSNV